MFPSLCELHGEEPFATVSMGWTEEGIDLLLDVHVPFEECFYPKYAQGDSVELFFDTRDVKTAGYATKFCHHFLLLPQQVQGIQKLELTHFRSEDAHLLADPDAIELEVEFSSKGYRMRAHFSKDALCGFDPNVCDRLGFTYKVNRAQGGMQHFSVSSHTYTIAQQPSLWASLRLTT